MNYLNEPYFFTCYVSYIGDCEMIVIRLYGKLRRYVHNNSSCKDNAIQVSPQSDETLETLLMRMEIPIEEIYTIFFNSKLLATRSKTARWLGYQQVRISPFDWDLEIPVKSGDRIGIFGRDMAALVI
jgi:hypothetical protein